MLSSPVIRKIMNIQCYTDLCVLSCLHNPHHKTQDLLFGLGVEIRLISSIIQQQHRRAVQISLTWYDYLLQWSLSPDCLAGWNTLVTTIFLPGRAATLSFAENQSVHAAFFRKQGCTVWVWNLLVWAVAKELQETVERVSLWGRLRFQTRNLLYSHPKDEDICRSALNVVL